VQQPLQNDRPPVHTRHGPQTALQRPPTHLLSRQMRFKNVGQDLPHLLPVGLPVHLIHPPVPDQRSVQARQIVGCDVDRDAHRLLPHRGPLLAGADGGGVVAEGHQRALEDLHFGKLGLGWGWGLGVGVGVGIGRGWGNMSVQRSAKIKLKRGGREALRHQANAPNARAMHPPHLRVDRIGRVLKRAHPDIHVADD